MLTAYDALTAGIFDEAGIPVLLVGDSAGNVVFGYETTIPVTVDDLIPLTAAVVRGTRRAMVVADLPFGSYQASPAEALHAAARFMKEAGAHAVKLEGGQRVAHHVEELVAAGVPVMGHVGLTPQSVHAFGGFRVQGRGRGRRAAGARRQGAGGGRRVRGRARGHPGRARRPDHPDAARPDDRHRRRAGLRRAGPGLAGHGRACRPARRSSPSATPTSRPSSGTPPPSSRPTSPPARSRPSSTPTASALVHPPA